MAAHVPFLQPHPTVDEILPGRAVRAPTWSSIAQAMHWAYGRGAQLIPDAASANAVLTSGNNYTYGFKCRPTLGAQARLWSITAHAGSAGELIVSTDGGTTTTTYPIATSDLGLLPPVLHIQELTAQSDAAGTTMEIEIEPTMSQCQINSIGCVEIPRPFLHPSTEDAIDLTQLVPGEPMFADMGPVGLRRLLSRLAATGRTSRRSGLFAWSVPYLLNGVVYATLARGSSSTGWEDFFGMPVPIQAPVGEVTSSGGLATSGDVTCWVLGRTSNTGQVRFTAASGDTASVTFSASSYTWQSTTLTVDTEDVTQTGGLRGGTRGDDVTIELGQTDGSNAVHVASIHIGEA